MSKRQTVIFGGRQMGKTLAAQRAELDRIRKRAQEGIEDEFGPVTLVVNSTGSETIIDIPHEEIPPKQLPQRSDPTKEGDALPQ